MKHTVLITGGSSGIGRAMVRAFVRGGYRAWFTYHRGKERAEALLGELPDGHARAFHFESGCWDSHSRLKEDLPGPVDILVNNAGLGSKTVEDAVKLKHEQDAALIMVNAVGTLWLTRSLLPSMLERGFGKIILISSVGGGVTQFPGFHYADGMSNAALAYFGRHLQAEHCRDPIDVFTICPGATQTPMFEASTLNKLTETERNMLLDSLPDRRLVEPEEIAKVAVWLCTDEARVLRGAVLDASLGLGVHPGCLTRGKL